MNLTRHYDCPLDVGSAVGQSWVCAVIPERGWTGPRWWFSYISQYNREWPFLGIIEALIISSVCLFGIPANIAATFNFHQRRVRPTFFLLVVILALCNILFCIFGIMVAVARLDVDWPWLELGCVGYFYGSLATLTMSLWTMILISFEQRICIASHRDKSKRLSVFKAIAILVFLICLDLALWAFPFVYLEIAELREVYVPAAKNGSDGDLVEVCTLFNYLIPLGDSGHWIAGSTLLAVALFLVTMITPIPILLYNYCIVMKAIRDMTSKFDLSRTASKMSSNSTVPVKLNSATGLLAVPPVVSGSSSDCEVASLVSTPQRKSTCYVRCRQRELFLTKLMIVIVFLFVVCTTPFNVVGIYQAFAENRYSVQSSYFVYSLVFIYVNAAVSPLLQSLDPGTVRRRLFCASIQNEEKSGQTIKLVTVTGSVGSVRTLPDNNSTPMLRISPGHSQCEEPTTASKS